VLVFVGAQGEEVGGGGSREVYERRVDRFL